MREVLAVPGVRRLFLASCVARLSMGALGLLIVLQTHALTGSYAQSGVATAAYAVALGISNPLLSRVMDIDGQTRVLCAGGVGASLAMFALAALPSTAGLGAIAACAAGAGAMQPTIGAAMRTLWSELIDDDAQRHTAYAMEGIVLEFVYICGPLLIVAAVGSWSLRAAIAICGATVLLGDLAFAAQPASRRWEPHPERATSAMGALRGPGIRLLLGVFALCGLAIGAIEVAVPAGLEADGHPDATGIVLAAWGVGSMLGGYLTSRAGVPRDAARRLSLLTAGWGVGHALVGLGSTPASYALLLVLAGVTIAPTFVCANGMLDWLAPAGTLTEAFTWTSTGLTAGIAVGSALAGVLVEATSPGLALAVLGSGGILAAVGVRLTPSRTLAPVAVAS